jgi:hypothetical protein
VATPVSQEWNDALAGPIKTVVYADAWYGAVCKFERLPILSGTFTGRRSGLVKYNLSMEVDSLYGQLTPYRDTDALAENGQRIHLRAGIRYGDPDDRSGLNEEILPVGRFRIDSADWDEDWSSYPTMDGVRVQRQGGPISIDAPDTSAAVEEDQFLALAAPDGTVFGEARRLLGDTMPLGSTHGLIDRRVPATVVYQDDKLKAIDDMAQTVDGYPASNVYGGLDLIPDRIRTPQWAVKADRNTLRRLRFARSRADVWNAVISSGTEGEENVEVSAVAVELYGPRRFHGPFGRKAQRHTSPLIDSRAMAQADSNTTLQRLVSRRVMSIPVTCPPNWALRIGDAITLHLWGKNQVVGQIDDFAIPLSGADMTMTLAVPLEEMLKVTESGE